MSIYIMIFISTLGFGGPKLITQEFSSKEKCELAINISGEKITKYIGHREWTIFCVEK